ncbi:MAG: hypothetical protein MJ057_09035 [Sphaerochaetaceae bacterium]|nr:hypothetical protein [Sphaerochaetaceae bacterium]
MKEIIASSAIPGIWTIAVLEMVLFVIAIRSYKNKGSKIVLLTACITIGLFLDAFIIGLGAFVNIEALRAISRIRFISHGVLIPLLFAICSLALDLKKPFSTIFYAITGILMVAGLAEALATVLDVTTIAGISRMASVKGQTPAWAEGISSILSFGAVIPLIIVGVIVWIREKTPYLFLAGFLMFAFSALGPATGNAKFIFYISMYGEILMVFFLYLYGLRKQKK